ncbi:hypothetical protein JYG23_02905 [Sedimentibacter sp. zth1]|uniref:hypothetical protein n=1 Tax=Sedimentibacter sp. zth1 TaxID=2816908 RepID=UPI001A911B4A|nr:hypothetical protein [Sedimentibacter sp. zth1]QSX06427.1 hypothetical protein JYG23_02905 [Sedimentibacter sp. zth1]
MKYKLMNSKITDENIILKLEKCINFIDYNKNNEYDIDIDYYNYDLVEDKLNNDIAYEIRKEHYEFIRLIRNVFKKNNINVNEVNLIGTVSNIVKGDINISVIKSKYQQYIRNNVVPCKEIFLYEDSKKTLDMLLQNDQISEEEYETNIYMLQEELDIDVIDEESEYIN